MGLNRLLADFLRRHQRIAIDTNVFIYQLQSHPRYSVFTDRVFKWLEQPGHFAVTSTITMTELLVHPYGASDERLIDEIYASLSTYPNLEWVAPNLPIADTAAGIRAQYGLRTPDALQAATAIHCHATGLVTNDAVFERVKELETLLLDRLL